MANWQKWIELAKDSQNAAQKLKDEHHRSCVSRIYYSAYQAVTAVLLYSKCVPPATREAWNHAETPGMLAVHCKTVLKRRDQRQDLARRLGTLYKLRVIADYISAEDIDQTTVTNALKDGNFLIKVAQDIMQ